jgi:hypothetical protein
MKAGAKITGNTTSDCGGVYVHEGAFTMEGGVISGNTAVTDGGGVVIEGGTFTMSGGVISGNTAGGGGYGGGGGVVVVSGSTFTMEGGVISGNTANQGGGVVVFDSSTFTMGGGEISGNTATSEGGGVYFTDGFGGGFTKTGGGTVYGDDAAGYDANGVPLKNTATQGDTYGHAVYVDSGSKYRDITALPGDNIDTTDHGTGLFAAMTGINAEDFGNFALIPKPITVDNNGNGAGSWNAALTAISGGGNDKNYVVNLTGGFSLNGLSSTDWSFGSASGVTVSLRGGGHTLSTGSHGSLLRVNDNQTLILRSLTMTGTTTNSASVVHVEGSSASLFMKDGATISGNTTSGGGGVAVNGGAFTMDGGEISGKTAGYMGGGVYVLDSSFTMGGGEIHGNTANYGGGVFVEGGSFNKTGGGIIYGDDDNDPDNGNADDNTATSAASGSGHAVYYVAGSSYPYTYYYRDTTLTATDNISTANTGSGWGQ